MQRQPLRFLPNLGPKYKPKTEDTKFPRLIFDVEFTSRFQNDKHMVNS